MTTSPANAERRCRAGHTDVTDSNEPGSCWCGEAPALTVVGGKPLKKPELSKGEPSEPKIEASWVAEAKRDHMAEEAECAHLWLDDQEVPRDDGTHKLSLVGRMKKLRSG